MTAARFLLQEIHLLRMRKMAMISFISNAKLFEHLPIISKEKETPE